MWTRPVVLGLLVLGSAAPLSGQAPLDSVVRKLRPGQTIRVASAQRGRVEGRLQELHQDALRLGEPGTPDVPLPAIDSLWVRGRSTGQGAVLGGLALGFIGAFAGGCGGGSDCPPGQGIAALAVGAGGGALLGALIGTALPRWKLRHAKPAPFLGLQWSPERPLTLSVPTHF